MCPDWFVSFLLIIVYTLSTMKQTQNMVKLRVQEGRLAEAIKQYVRQNCAVCTAVHSHNCTPCITLQVSDLYTRMCQQPSERDCLCVEQYLRGAHEELEQLLVRIVDGLQVCLCCILVCAGLNTM